MPLLTIAIPTYNRANLLEDRLREIFPQLQNEVEVLVCDDGSTDATAEVCARYLEKGLRYYRNSVNLGLSYNMLQTFLMAKGQWVWTLGDDDSLLPMAVKGVLDLIRKYPQAAAICFKSFGNGIHEEREISTIRELFQRLDISDVMFMSANIYQLAKVRPHFKVFAQATITIAPHVALIERTVESSSGPVQLSTVELLTSADDGKRWSSLELALGMSLLPEFIRDRQAQRHAALSVWCSIQWKFVYGLREITDIKTFQRWKRIRSTCFAILASYGVSYLRILGYNRLHYRYLKPYLQGLVFSLLPFFMVKTIILNFRKKRGGDKVSHDN